MNERKPTARLRVLLVVEPGLDGVFRHVEGLVDFLLSNNQSVHLVYSTRRSGEGMRAVVARVAAAGGETLDLKVANTPELRDFGAVYKIVGLIKRINPDIVHAHSSKAGALARIAARIAGHADCIYTPHAYYGMAKPFTPRVRFFNQVERSLGSIGRTVAISRDEAYFGTNVLNIAPSRLHVVHNPVDTERFVPPNQAQRHAARVKLGLPVDATILATIGRMCWQKDPETAYKAVAPLCKASPDLFFCHLGWGKWKDYLLGYAQKLGLDKQLKILGYTDDPTVVYHAVDAVLVTSRYEAGWPLVFLEALACNLPIIAANCPGMSDIDQAGLSHLWTFPSEDAAACSAAVEKWLQSRNRTEMTCNHRRFALERLSPARCYGSLVDLYRGIIPAAVTPVDAPIVGAAH